MQRKKKENETIIIVSYHFNVIFTLSVDHSYYYYVCFNNSNTPVEEIYTTNLRLIHSG